MTPTRPRPELVPAGSDPDPGTPAPSANSDMQEDPGFIQPLFPDLPLEQIAQIQVFSRILDPSTGQPQRARRLATSYQARDGSLHTVDEGRIGDDCGAGSFDVCARNRLGHILDWETVHIGETYVANRERERQAWVNHGVVGVSAGNAPRTTGMPPIMETSSGFVGIHGLDPQVQAFMTVMSSQLAAQRADSKEIAGMMVEMHKATMVRPIDASGSEATVSEYRRMLKQVQDENERIRDQIERERRSNTQLAVRHAEATAQGPGPTSIGGHIAQAAVQNAPGLVAALTNLLVTLGNANPAQPPNGPANGTGNGNNGNNGGTAN